MKWVACHAIWIGPRLGPLASACLRSFVRAGHPVVLHVYDEPEDVPEGVICADAEQTVPRARLIRHAETGSYALFANLFRYRLLQRGLGLYIDCDVVCVRPVEPDGSLTFGFQSENMINNAVMMLPHDSPVLRELVQLFKPGVFTPPWYSWTQIARQHIKSWVGMPADLSHASWGSAGPAAFDYFARKHGIRHLAEPPEVYYPVPFERASMFLDPSARWDSLIGERTRCVHLWNKMLAHVELENIPHGSPLQRLIDDEWP